MKYKMNQDWKFAEDGIRVMHYKKGGVYEVNQRCAEVCEETSCGEKASDKAKTQPEKDEEEAKAKAEAEAKAKAKAGR